MEAKMVKVKIEGQYYWAEGRVKQISNYDMEVEIPETEVYRALWYIQRKLVNDRLAKRNERSQGFRTCKIVSQLPAAIMPIKKDGEDFAGEESTVNYPTGPSVVPEPAFPKDGEEDSNTQELDENTGLGNDSLPINESGEED